MAQSIENGNYALGDSSANFNHTLVAGTSRIVVLMAGCEGELHLTTLEYGAATLANGRVQVIGSAEATAGAGNFQRMYAVLEADLPSNGSNTIVASGPAGPTWDIGVVQLNETVQAIPAGANLDTTIVGNGSNSITSTATAQANSIMLGQTGHGLSGQPTTASGTGTWSTLAEQAGTSQRVAQRYQQFVSSAGSKTLTESWGGGGTRAAQILASFEESSGGVPLNNASKSLFIAGMNHLVLPPLGFLRRVGHTAKHVVRPVEGLRLPDSDTWLRSCAA